MIPEALSGLLRAILRGNWCRADHTWSLLCPCGCQLLWRDPGREHAGEDPGMVRLSCRRCCREAEARRKLNDRLAPEGVCILGGDCLTGNVLWSIEALRARPLP